jgi:Flp pilus assembly protein TadG
VGDYRDVAEGSSPVRRAASTERTTAHGGRTHRRCGGDDGAALVEFAFVVPIFFLLVFGIMEFGWAFYQHLDVRHGAREGARLAAVNYKTTAAPTPADQATQIVNELCARMDTGDDAINIQITRTGGAVGDELVVNVSKDLQQLTGFLGFVLDGKTIDEEVHSRIEQPATWASMGASQPCP